MEEFFREVREGAAQFERRNAQASIDDPQSFTPSKKSEARNFARGIDIWRVSERLNYLRQSEKWDRLKTPFFIEEWNGKELVSRETRREAPPRVPGLRDDPLNWNDLIEYEIVRDGQRLRFRPPADDFQFDFRLVNLNGASAGHQVAVFFYRKGAAKMFTVIDPNRVTFVPTPYRLGLNRGYNTYHFQTALKDALGNDWKHEEMRFPDIQSCEDSSMIEGGACTLWATATVELVSRFGFEGARKAIEDIENRSRFRHPVSRSMIYTDVASSFILDYAGYLAEKIREMTGLENNKPDKAAREKKSRSRGFRSFDEERSEIKRQARRERMMARRKQPNLIDELISKTNEELAALKESKSGRSSEKQSSWFFRSLDEDSDEYMPRMAVGIGGYAF